MEALSRKDTSCDKKNMDQTEKHKISCFKEIQEVLKDME